MAAQRQDDCLLSSHSSDRHEAITTGTAKSFLEIVSGMLSVQAARSFLQSPSLFSVD
ncbi:hypothetical protein H6F43_10925 [Leptolyngbya sp. FACHB-36]|uniref:hypothetical protein n=1 Tax=Leptolyngbya sp. FACHB-36 TaxID=2692808 RepID=UPI0016812EB8|nr:hypothetical protein [Leptolyngbya sp. FACHB-36]MBD2020693.1 hypothetical protein [Leptolyngbya sp. FACHB-36]